VKKGNRDITYEFKKSEVLQSLPNVKILQSVLGRDMIIKLNFRDE